MGSAFATPVPTALRVGIVDRRPIVGERLRVALSSDDRLQVVGVFTDWRSTEGWRSDVDLWVSSEQGGGTLPRFSAEEYDLGEVELLCDAVHAASNDTTRDTAAPSEPAHRLLSPHEYAVLEATASGLTAAQTAEKLGVSVRSVETARRRTMEKLGATSGQEAVRLAHEIRGSGRVVRRSATRPEASR
ncbi:response regulator transcription factor [Blastococcus aurantiacus]|uniref:response regulator transcription factor n=1 Tax=Blastococcus aurantiacus TaxID=1550231 RepID=UPI000B870EC5